MKRLKNIFAFILLTCLFVSISFAESTLKIKVNNKYIQTDADPFITNGTTYVPIRFISEGLNIQNIAWDSNSKTVTLKSGSDTLRILINKNYAYKNGILITVPNPAILVNGRTFVPLRFVSENFDADVEWQESTDTVIITTASAAPPSSGSGSSSSGSGSSSSGSGSSSGSSSSSGSGSSSGSSSPSTPIAPSGSNSDLYTDYNDAVYWLSRIIEAEAAGESLKGKVAVGEVILNRVRSDEFPNTIWTVIFDTKFGIQFEPVANGSIYNTPSAESIKAAKIALDGSNYVGKCLYFLNPRIAQSNWISKNRVYYTTIGNHDFYL